MMTPYEAAVNMFHREHARWNQWVLFYFGSIVSIFVIGEKAKDYVPIWLLPLLCFVVSIMFVAVATTLRASTTAWRETLLLIENCDKQSQSDIKLFHVQKEVWDDFKHWKDLGETLLIWKKETITSVTRLLILFGIISAICFMALFLVTFFEKNNVNNQVFPEPVRNLPKADIPSDGIIAYLSQADTHQILFMEFNKDTNFPEHAHPAQFGIVLEGKIDLVIDGKKQCFTKGDRYYIPEGVKHTCKIYAGYAEINFFNDPHQYSKK